MIISDIIKKNTEAKLLNFFIENPTASFYGNDIARRLKISPGSVNSFVNKAAAEGLLHKNVIGSSHLYKLNNELSYVRQLKIAHIVIKIGYTKLIQDLLSADDSIITIAIYGSCAKGKNDEKSDIDLLVISSRKGNLSGQARAAENIIKKPINIICISLSDWKKMKADNKAFNDSVLRSNILLYGSEFS